MKHFTTAYYFHYCLYFVAFGAIYIPIYLSEIAKFSSSIVTTAGA